MSAPPWPEWERLKTEYYGAEGRQALRAFARVSTPPTPRGGIATTMRKPQFASKKSRSGAGWWKHARPFGKRAVNKSERKGGKQKLVKDVTDARTLGTSEFR